MAFFSFNTIAAVFAPAVLKSRSGGQRAKAETNDVADEGTFLLCSRGSNYQDESKKQHIMQIKFVFISFKYKACTKIAMNLDHFMIIIFGLIE